MMTEHPILFSAPMVRAILEGRKTQTRRVVKPGTRDDWNSCPYGVIGDCLWVRETWQVDAPSNGEWADTEFYGCKGAPLSMIPERYRDPNFCLFRASWLHSEITWRPSMFMPRWASRITLEVTGVRVERLQEISEGDAIKEGIAPLVPGFGSNGGWARDRFCELWDSINAKRAPWASNPWVWVIEFKRAPQ